MSLITRCPACGTSFRVVPDQLRISQGWVRCGQCAEIFDAGQALHDAAAPQAPATHSAQGVFGPAAPAGEGSGFADTVSSDGGGTPGSAHGDAHGENHGETHGGSERGSEGETPAQAAPSADAIDPRTPTLVDMAPPWAQTVSSEMPVTDSVASLDMGYAEYQQTQVQPESAPAPLAADAPGHGQPAIDGTADHPAAATADVPAAPAAVTPIDAAPNGAATPAAAPLEADALLPPADLGPGRLHVAPAAPGARSRPATAPLQASIPLLRRAAADAPEPAPAPSMVTARPPAPPPPKPLDPAVAELSFMRDAPIVVPPPAPPRTRRLRGVGAVAAVLLGLVLLLQWLVHERDRIAAAAPALRPVVQALCRPLGCSVQAPRRIDAVVIDGSSFVALGDDGYRLGFSLRNRAPHAVAVPAVVLSLTDIQEQPVVRRVLLPAELGTPPAELAAHGEWATSVDLRMGDNAGRARVVGYRLDAFYP